MKKIDKRADLKLSIPFLNKDGDLVKPTFPVKIEFFTTETIKKIANIFCTYSIDPTTHEQIITYSFDNCFFKDVTYINNITNETKVGPALIIPLNKPGFQPGILKSTIYAYNPDSDFRDTDNTQTVVKNVKTNIEII